MHLRLYQWIIRQLHQIPAPFTWQEHDVLWLEIPMGNLLQVASVEGTADLSKDIHRAMKRNLA